MRIVIDARTIADRFPGIGRYTYNLLLALGHMRHQHEIFALTCRSTQNTRYNLEALNVEWITTSANLFTLQEQWQIPMILRQQRADVYHATYYVRPYLGIPCPAVTTLYDTIPRRFPETASLQARLLFDQLHRLAIWRSAQLLTISHSAQADLIAAYQIAPNRLTVTPLAADPQFRPQSAEQIADLRMRYHLPPRYVLTVSSNKAHKNIAGLLRIWKACQTAMPMPLLVLAGHHDPNGGHPTARPKADEPDSLRELPNVPAADLPALYSGAALFILPSLYEGFGLPALEALASGTPVIGGRHSSMPEVVGDAGILVDLSNQTECVQAICGLLTDSALRIRLREAGLVQAARFSWERVAETTLHTYEQTANEKIVR